MTVSLDDLIAGNNADSVDAKKAMNADKTIKLASMLIGTTGLPVV